VGLWHDNYTTSWPILQAEICKNSVVLNFKMGRLNGVEYKDQELTMVVEEEHRFLIPNSISGPQIL
jgi:hypothetical protein